MILIKLKLNSSKQNTQYKDGNLNTNFKHLSIYLALIMTDFIHFQIVFTDYFITVCD